MMHKQSKPRTVKEAKQDRRDVIVKTIMRHTRQARISNIHALSIFP